MGGVMDERSARVLLSIWFESADTTVVARVRARGALDVVNRIVSGRRSVADKRGTAGRIAEITMDEAAARAQAVYDAATRIGARYVIPGDAEWPTQLDDLGDRAPLGLWVAGAGDLRLLALRSISVVGARSATSYGEGLARELGAHLAEQGWLTVSGGAFGIDAAAHRGSLIADGATACVLAGGVDVPYPRSHADLMARIRECGVLVSETPLGGAAMRHRFLTRNRIIAALSRATVMVEAALRSGSRTTAKEAAALRRVVMAFPGPVTSPMSAGCHALIRDQGAHLVTSPREVLAFVTGELLDIPAGDAPSLAWREQRVLDAVPVRRPAPLSSIAQLAGLGTSEAMAGLGMLDALGYVERRGEGWVRSSARDGGMLAG